MSYRRQSDGIGPFWGTVITIAVIAVIGGGIALATSYRAIDTHTVSLVYGGGPIDTNTGKFERTVGPGGRHNIGIMNKLYAYPVTNRTYTISADEAESDSGVPDAVVVTTADTGTAVDAEGVSYFRLNLDPDVLRAFHERYGLKYNAWDGYDSEDPSTGWSRMLRDLFRNSFQSAITAAGKTMAYDDFFDGEKVTAFEQTVGEELTTRLKANLGHDFFCGPATTNNPTTEDCNPLTFAMKPFKPSAQIAEANQRREVAERNLDAAKVEAEAILEAQRAGLTGMAYVANECRKAPESCPFTMVIAPEGTATSVQAPTQPTNQE